MIKIFIGQFINSGLILFLVNINIQVIKNLNLNFPLLNGYYNDFNSGWFKNVGCTIFLTMIISIITPHIWNIFQYLYSCIKRLCNSCNLTGKNSKINDYKSFMNLYVGPELLIDSRYAQVKNLIFYKLF